MKASESFSIVVGVSHRPMDDANLKHKLMTKPDAIDWMVRELAKRLTKKIPGGSSCQVVIGDLANGELGDLYEAPG